MLKRTPLQRKSSPLKRSSIKRKAPTEEQRKQQSKDIEKMWVLFDQHWNSKPHRCEQCNEGIWGENKNLYHHHLLQKGLQKYEHLKYEYDNLMLLCWQCHANVDSNPGDKVIERTEQAHKRFEI